MRAMLVAPIPSLMMPVPVMMVVPIRMVPIVFMNYDGFCFCARRRGKYHSEQCEG